MITCFSTLYVGHIELERCGLGQRIVPLREGSAYLGFIFSRAATPAETSLRRAHAVLDFTIR